MLEKDKVFSEKPWSQWTELESKRAQYDCIAKNIITFALNFDEFFRVSKFAFARKMWDILEVTHEGTINVKNNKDKNQPSSTIPRMLVNLILQTTLVLDVVNMDTSRLNVQAM